MTGADADCFALNVNRSVQLPFTRYASEHVTAMGFESEPRSCNEVAERLRNQYFAGARKVSDAGTDMNCYSGQILGNNLTFAGV
jgi:hypothetical protein